MKQPGQPLYVTTAIAYPNGDPHIGHAYEIVLADALVRWLRRSETVYFLTGTDEHGQKMVDTARANGISVEQQADLGAYKFNDLYEKLGVHYNRFIRTTYPEHHICARALWRRLDDAGDIYKDVYKGWYSVKEERYLDEKETSLSTAGPLAGERIYQTESGIEVVYWTEEESYFFRLSKYRDRILSWLIEFPEAVQPERSRNEIISILQGGLRDISISRSRLKWGIPVPNDPSHVMYVWIDALANYLTGANYPVLDGNWPPDYQIIGKDIVRFHAIYWPAFLMSAGIELPTRIFAHGFLLKNGLKASKSSGGQDDVFDITKKATSDGLRYFFLSSIAPGQDSSYTLQGIEDKINADLANNIGNLLNRVLGQIHKSCGGKIPVPNPPSMGWQDEDLELWNESFELYFNVSRHLDDGFQTHLALEAVIKLASHANQYIARQEPWKADQARKENILYLAANALNQIGLQIAWACPDLAGHIYKLLNSTSLKHGNRLDSLEGGRELHAPYQVFPRVTL